MEEQVDHLVGKAWSRFETLDPSRRLLIAISGIPGSGKTTLASTLASRLNSIYHSNYSKLWPNSPGTLPIVPDICTSLPLDGYHLTRAELSALPNAEEAHFRRGAAFTFNGAKFLELVKILRQPLLPETRTIYAPSFDHAVKDPVENDIAIPPTSRIVIFEGNYLSLNAEPWSEAAALMDELWFVDVPIPVASERLITRHVKAGIVRDEEHARTRVEGSDMRNGREILENKVPNIHEIVTSKEDDAWRPGDKEEAQRLEAEKHAPDGKNIEFRTARYNGEVADEELAELMRNQQQRPEMERRSTGSASLAGLAEAGGGC